jgi:hypothetical protein
MKNKLLTFLLNNLHWLGLVGSDSKHSIATSTTSNDRLGEEVIVEAPPHSTTVPVAAIEVVEEAAAAEEKGEEGGKKKRRQDLKGFASKSARRRVKRKIREEAESALFPTAIETAEEMTLSDAGGNKSIKGQTTTMICVVVGDDKGGGGGARARVNRGTDDNNKWQWRRQRRRGRGDGCLLFER